MTNNYILSSCFRFLGGLMIFHLLVLGSSQAPAYAATVPLTGQATVLNTDGLIDFSEANSNVVLDDATGELSGYAWSEDMGWCDFGQTDNPEGPVSVDLTDGSVAGQAYCLNTTGHIDFSSNNSNVAIDLLTGSFSGYAWSEDLGWIDFADPGVSTTPLSSSDVVISEIYSSNTPWIELANYDQNANANLSGWSLENGSQELLASLSGLIPRGGFLTFELTDDAISTAGDCLMLYDDTDTLVDAISYGTGSCSSGTHTDLFPSQDTTIYLTPDNGWLESTPTKGWCAVGTSGCPGVDTLADALATAGVETNLHTYGDTSRITGLFFELPNIGKIEFLSEMNLTDRDALSWLGQLDTKLDLSQAGTISLDADLIKNLVNTNARLTMYGLSLSDPKVLVDGLEDTEGVVSDLTYDSATGTLVFTAAHFTTFQAVEDGADHTSHHSSHSSSPKPPSCSADAPVGAPDLFEIRTDHNSAKLYFAPAGNPVNKYFIAYSTDPTVFQYGTEFVPSYNDGVIEYTINDLLPNATYYYSVRAGHDCAPGEWSGVMSAKNGKTQTQKIFYKY